MPEAKTDDMVQKKRSLQSPFPSIMTPKSRQDLISLKQQLADALGENGPLYWDALKSFVAGKLNRQEFDFYANLYLSREHAYLHNAFILSTIHNAQTGSGPPSKHRSVGWAKRKRGKDGALLDANQERDPLKRQLKMDVMSLSKADRERLKALLKLGDKDKLRPLFDKLLGPRISRPPRIPIPPEKLPSNFNADYQRGLLAPLCTDLKELPGPDTLHARMNSIALEHGLTGGVTEEAVSAMLFATESYVKSAIANAVSKRRVNRSIGVKMKQDTASSKSMALQQTCSQQSQTTTKDPSTPEESPSLDYDHNMSESSSPLPSSSSSVSSSSAPVDSITLRDLAFSFFVSPYVLVENPLNAEKLTALLTDSEDEVTDEDLGESSSEAEFDI